MTNTDTFSFRILIKNPCVNFGEVTLATVGLPTSLSPKYYYIGDVADQFTGPSFTYSVGGSTDFCGPIKVTASYGAGASPAIIDGDDMPLAYSSPNFTIESDNIDLIG